MIGPRTRLPTRACLSGVDRRCAGARPRRCPVRRRRQHDRRCLATLAAVNHSVAAEREALFPALRGQVARRALGARQVVRAAGGPSLRPDMLARVRSLLAPHPEVRRPQSQPCARAGPRDIRAAATGLPFINPDPGSGYDFVTDQILSFDRRNPQTAASLAGAFNLLAALRRAAPDPPACRALRAIAAARRSSRRMLRKSSSGISRIRCFAPFGYSNVAIPGPAISGAPGCKSILHIVPARRLIAGN